MTFDSQQLESFVPVYDTVPETWDDARPFLVEQLKKISNAVNIREIGWYLDEELLSGKAFIPGAATLPVNSTPLQYRQIFRKVIDVSPLVAGANVFNHGINVDNRFTLIDLWVAATNSGTLTSQVITDANVMIIGAQIHINSPGAFDRAFAIVEYIQEL